MRVTGFELHWLSMPLRAPLRTTFGAESVRETLLVRALTTDGDGWGECVATSWPAAGGEYVDGAAEVIRRFLAPRLLAEARVDPARVAGLLAPVPGHRTAKAAVEMAVLDAWLRARNQALASFLGAERERVPAGVSVGIMESVPQLLDAVGGFLDQGYARVMLAIEPGWDLQPVRAVRERFGEALLLQVDANAAYRRGDARTLAALDEFDLLLLEQPLPEADLRGHAALAAKLRTPVGLDQSIGSAQAAAEAITLGAAGAVAVTPGRVGGYLEARRVHEVCRAHGVPVRCGGMWETGLGRAGNLALAGLPGFTLPGDTSASGRYFTRDLTEPFQLDQGQLVIPDGAGLGVAPLPEALAELRTAHASVR